MSRHPSLASLALLAACGGAQHPAGDPCKGDRVITGAEGLKALSGCRTLDGDLAIRGGGELDMSLLAGLETVTGDVQVGPTFGLDVVKLEGLREVGGALRVVSNGFATGVYLPRVERVGSIEIAANVGVLGAALPALREVRGDLVVTGNPAMENLTAGKLERVGGVLRIEDNRVLEILELGQVKKPF